MKLDELRNLDPQNIGGWPLPIKVALIAVVCAAVAYGGYTALLKSQQAQLEQEISKEDKIRKELEEKAHKVVNLDLYKRKLEKMKQSFGAMLRQLPDKNEVAELLVDISQSGLASGLEFQLFNPEKEIKKGFYAELPIRLRVTGNYHQFGKFISEVAGLSRIVTVHDFRIFKDKDSANLVMEATAKTYRYLDEQEQMRAAPKKGDGKGKKKKRRRKGPIKKKG